MYNFGAGVAGLGWVFQHFISLGLWETDEETLQDCDEFVAKMGIRSFGHGNYDHMYGGVGCGLYFLERDNTAILEIMIQALHAAAIEDKEGMRWYDMLARKKGEGDVINLGVAHGLPSVMYFLAQAYQKGIMPDLCLEMINAVSRFIFQFESSDHTFAFPGKIKVQGQTYQPDQLNRLAWCYGDLGMSALFVQAGKITNNQELIEAGTRLGKRTCRLRSHQETHVQDGGLCHGSFGVAHTYRRLYQYTGQSDFHVAANFWEEASMNFVHSFSSPENYKEWYLGKWEASYGFLTGLTGAGLAMIGRLSPNIDPRWDRALLLS